MVKGQGGNKSGAFSVLVTLCMMQQCVHKEASQLFCEKAVKARVEDGVHVRNGTTMRAARYVPIAGGTLVEVKTILMPMGRAWASE